MKIILKDGTEIQNAMVGKMDNFLELTMGKTDAVDNIHKFVDPETMSEITYIHGVWKTIYTGYNVFLRIDNPKENEMRVWMIGEDETSTSDPIPLVDEQYLPKGE